MPTAMEARRDRSHSSPYRTHVKVALYEQLPLQLVQATSPDGPLQSTSNMHLSEHPCVVLMNCVVTSVPQNRSSTPTWVDHVAGGSPAGHDPPVRLKVQV